MTHHCRIVTASHSDTDATRQKNICREPAVFDRTGGGDKERSFITE
jgi:hypothetical protein